LIAAPGNQGPCNRLQIPDGSRDERVAAELGDAAESSQADANGNEDRREERQAALPSRTPRIGSD
jgi:hypothetical protein